MLDARPPAVLLQADDRIPNASDAVVGQDPPLLWRVVGAVLVLAAGWYVSKLVVRAAGRTIARRFQRPSITQTVLRSLRLSVILFSIVIAAQILRFRPGNILLSVTVFSAIVAVILAPIVGSVINGLFVLADQPFEIGDMIELVDEGQKGFVEDITIRYTKMFTLDNTFIVIPNSTIRERDVINYSAEDERTRRSTELLVTYESDVDQARRVIQRAARDVDSVIGGGPAIRIGSARYPAAPTVYIDEYADDGILLSLRYWVKRPYKLQAVESEIHENVRAGLADADVEIAYPHTHLVFDETSGRAEVALARVADRSPAARGAAGIPTEDRETAANGDSGRRSRETGGADRTPSDADVAAAETGPDAAIDASDSESAADDSGSDTAAGDSNSDDATAGHSDSDANDR